MLSVHILVSVVTVDASQLYCRIIIQTNIYYIMVYLPSFTSQMDIQDFISWGEVSKVDSNWMNFSMLCGCNLYLGWGERRKPLWSPLCDTLAPSKPHTYTHAHLPVLKFYQWETTWSLSNVVFCPMVHRLEYQLCTFMYVLFQSKLWALFSRCDPKSKISWYRHMLNLIALQATL